MKRPLPLFVLILMTSVLTSCVLPNADSPVITSKLKTVSAGYTGCMPDDNQISNLNAKYDGSGTWNATCKGKSYLCSGVASTGGSESFSCAPVVQ